MPKSVRNKQNPKNAQSTLFKKLTRLLSGPIVNYRTQTARRLKRRQLDMYAKRFTSASGKQFKRMDYNPFAGLYGNAQNSQNRLERYVDFDQMEYTPEIASALDIYADEMTNHSFLSPLMSIDCNNEEIKGILNAPDKRSSTRLESLAASERAPAYVPSSCGG